MGTNGGSKILHFLTNPMFIGWLFSIDVVIVRFYIYPKYYPLLEKDFQLISNFIEWFGVAYGLFIALVLVNVWSQFDNTEREFDREADAIFMLYQSVKQIKDSSGKIKGLKTSIIESIKDYVLHVNQNYMVEHQKLDVRDAGDTILEQIRDKIGDVVHTREREAITSELIKEYNDAIDVRGDRISHSKRRIPRPVWGISIASSTLWLIPFLGLNFFNDWIAIILVGGVTVIVIAILSIINDLDDPFDGVWKIDTAEWELLAEKIGISPTLIFVFNMNHGYFYKLWAWVNKMFSSRLCVLYTLLNGVEQQRALYDDLSDVAGIRIYFKNEFEDLYEKRFPLPAVLYKTGNTLEQIINNEEINNCANLEELNQTIHRRL